MRCWACSKAIGLDDLVMQLPIIGAIVHIACYERETGQRADRPLRVEAALANLVGRVRRRRSPKTEFVTTRITSRKRAS